jgi:phosphoglycolate phosphatase
MTLIDNMFDFYEAYNLSLKRFLNKTISFNKFYYLLNNYLLDNYLPQNIDKISFWRFFRRIYRTRHGRPVRGAYYFLYWVKTLNFKTLIISGRECPSQAIWFELDRFGLREYIDEIYTLFNVEIHGGIEEELFDKSWLIKYALKKHGLTPGEVIYLGDYRQDLISSRKVGIRFIGIAFSEERMRCLYSLGAEYVARDLYEALNYLWIIIGEYYGLKHILGETRIKRYEDMECS